MSEQPDRRPGDPQRLRSDHHQGQDRSGEQADKPDHGEGGAKDQGEPAERAREHVRAEQDGPLSPTELANRVGFTTGGITTVVDRLEQAGYVRRVADPRDRRRLLIEKTAKTSERDHHEVFGGLARMTLESLATYSENELAAIQRFLEGTREITARHAEDLARDAATPGRQAADGDEPMSASAPEHRPIGTGTTGPAAANRVRRWPLPAFFAVAYGASLLAVTAAQEALWYTAYGALLAVVAAAAWWRHPPAAQQR